MRVQAYIVCMQTILFCRLSREACPFPCHRPAISIARLAIFLQGEVRVEHLLAMHVRTWPMTAIHRHIIGQGGKTPKTAHHL